MQSDTIIGPQKYSDREVCILTLKYRTNITSSTLNTEKRRNKSWNTLVISKILLMFKNALIGNYYGNNNRTT